MIDRRDLLIGVASAAAVGASFALKPHRRVSLLGTDKVAQIVPGSLPGWSGRDVSDLAAPKEEDSLASRLYGETVVRTYQNAPTGGEVTMLLAHGDSQTDQLQLHRPEICYPAVGFELVSNKMVPLPLSRGVTIPTRWIVAKASGHVECIVYWTRLGEYLPATGAEQRRDQLRTAMDGYIADGLLARFSALGPDTNAAFATISTFIPYLIASVAPGKRRAIIGTRLADELGAIRA